jgi:hypothetical protein
MASDSILGDIRSKYNSMKKNGYSDLLESFSRIHGLTPFSSAPFLLTIFFLRVMVQAWLQSEYP